MHKSKFTLTTWLARRLWANDFQGGMLFWPTQEAVIFVGILAQCDYIIYDLNRCFLAYPMVLYQGIAHTFTISYNVVRLCVSLHLRSHETS